MLEKIKSPLYELNFLAFASGFFSLCIQVIATHYAFLAHPQSSYAIGMSLFSFLTGLGIASTLAVKYQSYLLKNYRLISGRALFFVGIYFGLLSLFHNELRNGIRSLSVFLIENPGGRHLLAITFLSFLFLLLPAIFIGIIYPIANDRRGQIRGIETGKTSFFDYLGASAGALFCSFLLVPYLGLKTSSVVVVVMILVVSLFWQKNFFKILTCLFIGVFIWVSRSPLIGDLRKASSSIQPQKIIYSEPSPYGDVIVTEKLEGSHNKRLTVGLRGMCAVVDNKSEILMADLSLQLLKKSNLAVSNVGLGCGYTARRLKYDPRVGQLDIIEINPQIKEASRFFGAPLEESTGAKTQVHIEDGYNFLKLNPNQKYDAIIVDVEEPSVIHSSALFTYDYFIEAKEHLLAGGVFSIWNFYQPETNRIILNSLRATFKYADVAVISNRAVFVAGDFPIDLSKVDQSKEKKEIILKSPQTEIATVTDNPYPKYFKVNSVFGLPSWYEDPFEL